MNVVEVDRSSPVPLWAQVLDHLRGRLARGEFDERFPSDFDLVAAYGVSRPTIREAVRQLELEGRIQRARGRATTVRRERLESSIGTLPQLFAALRADVGEVSATVVRQERTIAPDVAGRLGRPAGTPLVVVQRVRWAGGHPIALDTAWIPEDVAPRLLAADFTRAVLADELRAAGVEPDGVSERISAELADPAALDLLGATGPLPLLVVTTVSSAAGEPVEVREVAFRGDRFSLRASWGASGPPVLGGHASVAGAGLAEQVDAAIRAHRTWREQLGERVRSGQVWSAAEVAEIGRDDRCALGRWLLELPPALVANPALPTVRDAHTEFHRAVAESVALMAAGASGLDHPDRLDTTRLDAAIAGLGRHSRTDRASRRLTRALRALLDTPDPAPAG